MKRRLLAFALLAAMLVLGGCGAQKTGTPAVGDGVVVINYPTFQCGVNRLKREKNAVHFVGIAADEAHRCKNDPTRRYPLVEWGITEAQHDAFTFADYMGRFPADGMW